MVEKGPVQQSEACEVSSTVSEVNKTNVEKGPVQQSEAC